MSGEHRGYKDVDSRLARMEGQVGGIRRMWQEGRPCHEVLQQLAALQGATKSVTRVILREHVESCIAPAMRQGSGEEAVDGLVRALEGLL